MHPHEQNSQVYKQYGAGRYFMSFSIVPINILGKGGYLQLQYLEKERQRVIVLSYYI